VAQELQTKQPPMIADRADETADQNQHSIQIPTYFGGSSFTSERSLIIQGVRSPSTVSKARDYERFAPMAIAEKPERSLIRQAPSAPHFGRMVHDLTGRIVDSSAEGTFFRNTAFA
jgi:hypothetical protein